MNVRSKFLMIVSLFAGLSAPVWATPELRLEYFTNFGSVLADTLTIADGYAIDSNLSGGRVGYNGAFHGWNIDVNTGDNPSTLPYLDLNGTVSSIQTNSGSLVILVSDNGSVATDTAIASIKGTKSNMAFGQGIYANSGASLFQENGWVTGLFPDYLDSTFSLTRMGDCDRFGSTYSITQDLCFSGIEPGMITFDAAVAFHVPDRAHTIFLFMSGAMLVFGFAAGRHRFVS